MPNYFKSFYGSCLVEKGSPLGEWDCPSCDFKNYIDPTKIDVIPSKLKAVCESCGESFIVEVEGSLVGCLNICEAKHV